MQIKLLIAVLFLFLSQSVYAQSPYEQCLATPGNTPAECNYLSTNPTDCDGDIACLFTPAQFFRNPSSVVNLLLSNLLLIAGIILFLLVVFAGFQMITSGGDAHKMEKWRNMLMYGVAGFVIILVAGAVIALVETFTGVNILDPEAVLNGG